MSLLEFVEKKINYYANAIVTKGDKLDNMSEGELHFCFALRRVLGGNATITDLGLLDAINDTLQQLGKVEQGQTFYK